MIKSISIVKAKFKRLKVESDFTKLWEDVIEENKFEINKIIDFSDNEAGILFFLDNKSYWWLLTNQRLILYEKKRINYFHLSNIEKVEVKEVFEDEISKQDCSNIDLKISNSYIKLKVEKNTWHAIYNIFKFVINN